jgi:alpha-glucosidase (family GH31 glycosyl hydrolase)
LADSKVSPAPSIQTVINQPLTFPFLGPQPSPELLLRWIQLGIYSPRFAINCFKTSPDNSETGEVIEPWMYPEITPNVRAAIKRRYEILPYIYSLGIESHLHASPPQRWVGWGYESDPEVWTKALKRGEEQFWFGSTILVGGVYEPGVEVGKVYLPRKSGDVFDYGFVNMNAPYTYYASGQWVDIPSQWKSSIPLLAKIGGAIPVGKSVQTRIPGDETEASLAVAEVDDYRGVEIFPPRGSSHETVFSTTWLEDDGISIDAKVSKYTISYSSTEDRVIVGFNKDEEGGFVPAWKDLDIILHTGDARRVVSDVGKTVEYKGQDARGREVYTLKY